MAKQLNKQLKPQVVAAVASCFLLLKSTHSQYSEVKIYIKLLVVISMLMAFLPLRLALLAGFKKFIFRLALKFEMRRFGLQEIVSNQLISCLMIVDL